MLRTIFFVGYFVILLGIGFVTFRRTKSHEDYALAGRSNNMWVTAISATSSDMSGWLLLGVPGLAYAGGLSAIWTVIGILVGNYFNWVVVSKRLRLITQKYNAVSLSEYFEKRFNDKKGSISIISAIIIVVFMIINASAEVIGSGKLLNASFNIDYNTAIIISLLIVLVYTFLGGYLAVSWSNLLQGTLIFLALIIVPIAGLVDVGSIGALGNNLVAQDSSLLSFFGSDETAFAIFGLVIGGLGIGVGYPGQPHIMTSYMSIEDPEELRHSTLIAMFWTVITTYGAVMIGLLGRAIIPTLDDPETIYLSLVEKLFSSNVIGLFAAAVMAAILSSVSAYLLVAATSTATNVYSRIKKDKEGKQSLIVERVAIVIIGVLAFLMSLEGGIVFTVALFAWGGLAASFGPLIIGSLYWKGVNLQGAIASMLTGMVVNLVWYYSGLSQWVYELIPAIILSTIVMILVSKVTRGPDEKTRADFEAFRAEL